MLHSPLFLLPAFLILTIQCGWLIFTAPILLVWKGNEENVEASANGLSIFI